MSDRSEIPGALRVVAILHLVTGVCAAVEMLVQLNRSHLQANFGVLGIPICIGLLRLRRGWRTCALVLLSIGLVLMPIAFFVGLAGSGAATFGVLGIPLGQLGRSWFCFVAAAAFLLMLWQFRVLVRPDVARLFVPVPTPATSGDG